MVAVLTLGCKLNQLESEAIAASYRDQGLEVSERPTKEAETSAAPSLVIVNTCTVTSKAEQKARRLIRQALREGSRVIVTGCWAQLNKDDILAMDTEASAEGRLSVLAGRDKALLLKGKNTSSLFAFAPPGFGFHSRAAIKIQDGCNNHCNFCRSSVARGPAESLEPETILARLRQLEEAGFAEAVITGLNLCQYSSRNFDFGSLLCYLLENTRHIALRLSSLEPERLSPPFFRALESPRLRPHFHLSIQSGSDAVLARMGRKYQAASIEALAAELRRHKDDPFLAADVIAGFCGESDADFEATIELCRRLDLAWIHAFPFSRRPGTPAWAFRNRVPEAIAQKRVEALSSLARKGRASYIARQEGRLVDTVVENNPRTPAGYTAGLTENYLNVLIQGSNLQPGSSLKCRLSQGDLTKNGHFDMIGLLSE